MRASLRSDFWRSRLGSAAALLIGLISGLVFSFAVERLAMRGRVLHGVALGGTDLEGLDGPDVWRRIEPRAREIGSRPVQVRLANQVLSVDARVLGVTLDVASHVDRALETGRTGPGIIQLAEWLSRLFAPDEIEVDVQVDRNVLDAAVDDWERQRLEGSAFAGTIVFDSPPAARYPRAGRSVDREALAERLRAEVLSATANVEVPLRTVQPSLSRHAVDAALERARRLVAEPVVLEVFARKTDDATEPPSPIVESQAATEELDRPSKIVLSQDELRQAARARITDTPAALHVEFDPEKIHALLEAPRKVIEVEPRDAGFDIKPNGKITVTPSATGTQIDEARLLTRLDAIATGGPRKFPLPMLPDVPPSLDTETAHSLGIDGLVAKFTTYHNCCQPRVRNIHRMADLIDGVIVLPGQIFSVNRHVGPRTAKNGFVMAPTIVLGDMENTVGGGVSQFATTLFNAVLDGGYEIIQRQPHSFYFPRYPVGHEATLSYPSPDLSFRNDSKAGLLIKTQYGKKHIRVLLYGDNGGRKVERKVGPRIDRVDPPIEFVANESIPPEGAKLLRRGEIGWSVVVSRTIRFADGHTTRQRRKVVYKPRPRVVEVHPCNVPKGHDGYTGEDCPEPDPADGGKGEGEPGGLVRFDQLEQ